MNPWPLPEGQPVFPACLRSPPSSFVGTGAWKGAADCLHWPDGVRQKPCPFLGLERHSWLPLHLHQEHEGLGWGWGSSLPWTLSSWLLQPGNSPSVPLPISVFFHQSKKSFLSGVFTCVSDVGGGSSSPSTSGGLFASKAHWGGGFPTPLPCHDPPLACKGAGGAHSLKGGQLSSLPKAAAQLREALLFGAQSAEQHKESSAYDHRGV